MRDRVLRRDGGHNVLGGFCACGFGLRILHTMQGCKRRARHSPIFSCVKARLLLTLLLCSFPHLARRVRGEQPEGGGASLA